MSFTSVFSYYMPALSMLMCLLCLGFVGCDASSNTTRSPSESTKPKVDAAPTKAQPVTRRSLDEIMATMEPISYAAVENLYPSMITEPLLAYDIWEEAYKKGFAQTGAQIKEGSPSVSVSWSSFETETKDGLFNAGINWRCILSVPNQKPADTLSEHGQIRALVAVDPTQIKALQEKHNLKAPPAKSMMPSLTQAAKQCAIGLRIQQALPKASSKQLIELALVQLPKTTTLKVLLKLETIEPIPGQALIALLNNRDDDVTMKAMRAIVDNKVMEADRPMVELATRFSETRNMEGYVGTLFQLGRLGGPEGKRYLETVASGHTIPQIRDVAARALKGIK